MRCVRLDEFVPLRVPGRTVGLQWRRANVCTGRVDPSIGVDIIHIIRSSRCADSDGLRRRWKPPPPARWRSFGRRQSMLHDRPPTTDRSGDDSDRRCADRMRLHRQALRLAVRWGLRAPCCTTRRSSTACPARHRGRAAGRSKSAGPGGIDGAAHGPSRRQRASNPAGRLSVAPSRTTTPGRVRFPITVPPVPECCGSVRQSTGCRRRRHPRSSSSATRPSLVAAMARWHITPAATLRADPHEMVRRRRRDRQRRRGRQWQRRHSGGPEIPLSRSKSRAGRGPRTRHVRRYHLVHCTMTEVACFLL